MTHRDLTPSSRPSVGGPHPLPGHSTGQTASKVVVASTTTAQLAARPLLVSAHTRFPRASHPTIIWCGCATSTPETRTRPVLARFVCVNSEIYDPVARRSAAHPANALA